MSVKIQATKMQGKDLKPGDLFSTQGAEFWEDALDLPGIIGQKAYIRTNTAASQFADPDAIVYKLDIVEANRKTPMERYAEALKKNIEASRKNLRRMKEENNGGHPNID